MPKQGLLKKIMFENFFRWEERDNDLNTVGAPNLSVYRVRTVPYRFPRGTVLVNRAAYRTFLTVFRDFCLKARTLLRFKFYRSSVLTLIFR